MTTFNVIRICALTGCLFFGFSTGPFAQETSKTEASSGIFLSLEDEALLIGMAQFRENLNSRNEAGKKTAVQIILPDDKGKLTVHGVIPEFKKTILEGDDAAVLLAMQTWNYEFLFPIHDDKIRIGVRDKNSPEYQLFRAAMINHLPLAKRLVNEYELDPNVEFKTSVVDADKSALTVAVMSQHSEMVELLLKAGADPLIKTHKYGSPLKYAVENKDTQSTRALFDAGATIEHAFNKNTIKPALFRQIVKDKNSELVGLLLDNGMQIRKPRHNPFSPDRADTDTRVFTPLMEALLNGDSDMVAVLLPYSDPRFVTTEPIARSNSGIETLKIIPRANALFIAQISPNELEPSIPQAITDRIEALGGVDAVTMSNIDLASSKSDMAYLAGDLAAAKEILTNALSGLSVNDIKRSSEEKYAATVKWQLLKKHELALITNDQLSDEEQALATELADMGEPTGRWHSMFEIIQQASTGDYFSMLDEWQQQYAGEFTFGWDYSRLNAWIRTFSDNAVKKRTYRALDYFEFGLSRDLWLEYR